MRKPKMFREKLDGPRIPSHNFSSKGLGYTSTSGNDESKLDPAKDS